MLLNEDYFNEIEITDDDITDKDTNYNNEQQPDIETYFNHMFSDYTHCIGIIIEQPDLYNNKVLWEQYYPHLIKRLNYVFSTYDIEYSEPIFMEFWDVIAFSKYKSQIYKYKYRIFNYHNFKVIGQETVHLDDSMKIMIFFNLPKFTSLKQAFRFICSILRNIKNDFPVRSSLKIHESSKYQFDCDREFMYIKNDYVDIIDNFLNLSYNMRILEYIYIILSYLVPEKASELNFHRSYGNLYDFLIQQCL